MRERHGLTDHINLDLTYAVCFNLAYCYHQNDMRKEVSAINILADVLDNSNLGRFVQNHRVMVESLSFPFVPNFRR